MPSLIIYIEENLQRNTNFTELEDVEHKLIQIITKELEAKKDNCQIVWIYSKILTSKYKVCLLYTSPSPRDGLLSRMPSSA